jgi:XTP/dITP diphosphohydrolase
MPSLNTSRLVLATHNAGKLREMRKILGASFGEIVSAGELGLPEPEETGSTFVENALIKAHAAAKASQCLVLADDSGLCVAALNGDPGLYSARWAGPGKDFKVAMQRVHEALDNSTDRSAYFIAVLALVSPDGKEEIFEGRADGRIAWPPRGDKGHGYDPVFIPDGETRSFAEMEEGEKNRISHRGRAMQKLLAWLEKVASY